VRTGGRGPAHGFRHRPLPPTVVTMTNVPFPPDPSDPAEEYVGLPAETAEERARSRGWTTVRSLPPGAIITLEYLTGRINFEVEGGTVIRCWQG
jgi:hypothetical protein